MRLTVIGVNHLTAAIELREQFAIPVERQKDALLALRARLENHLVGVEQEQVEALILSTCNRTEVVCNQSGVQQLLLDWLLEYCGVDSIKDSEYFFLQGSEAWQHLVRVASGLDSMVMGEPQIFGQFKAAHALALRESFLGLELAPMMQQIFNAAKRVRHDTAIGENPVSVAYAAVSVARRIFADLTQASVLLIGAGETIRLVAKHLFESGVGKISVANRNLENASELAKEFNAAPLLLSEIPDVLAQQEIVISSTASSLPILGKGAVEEAIKQRKRKPMFMLDLAVPRDIEAQVSELPDVFLYSIDDLRGVVDENLANRERERSRAEEIIDNALSDYIRWKNSREAVDLVVEYRRSVDRSVAAELERVQKQIGQGVEPEELLETLARSISRKLMHGPTVAMRDAAAREDKDFLRMAQTLLGLTDPDSSNRNEE